MIAAIHHAGASGQVFLAWRSRLQHELVPISLPGRIGSDARPCRTIAEAAEVTVDLLTQSPGQQDFVLFGHSMGALVAYETARRLGRRARRQARLLITSGMDAPHTLAWPRPKRYLLDNAGLLEKLREFNGTPNELLEAGNLEPFLPQIRADLAMVDTYQWQPGPQLDMPILCYYGRSDDGVSDQGLRAWADLTDDQCGIREFEGDHFYLSDPDSICHWLNQDIARITGRVLTPTSPRL